MAKSDKLYSKSPKIEKDEKGKPGIKKPSKADAESMGIEGNEIPGAGDGMPVDPHEAERAELSKRHVEEIKDMHKRHEKDHEAMHKRHHEANKAKETTEKSGKELDNSPAEAVKETD